MMPSSMALIGQAYPDPVERARAVAMWAMGGAVASSSGPVLGGLLTLVSWRLIFFINVPVGAVALVLLARTAPLAAPAGAVRLGRAGHRRAGHGRADLRRDRGRRRRLRPRRGCWPRSRSPSPALAAFLVVQARGAHPMVPLELFRSRTVAVAVAVGFAFVVGYYGLPFVMSLYLQQLRGLSPLGDRAWCSCR